MSDASERDAAPIQRLLAGPGWPLAVGTAVTVALYVDWWDGSAPALSAPAAALALAVGVVAGLSLPSVAGDASGRSSGVAVVGFGLVAAGVVAAASLWSVALPSGTGVALFGAVWGSAAVRVRREG